MPRHILLPLIVACALFMENMDSTVLVTALPAIAGDLGVNPLALKLALTAYLVSLAVFIPISGWVADRRGSRTVFTWAIVGFMSGSLMCAFSSTLAGFVVSRFIQGIGGAMMVPVGRLILLRAVPKRELVKAMTWLTLPALLGPVLGPPLGGVITEYFHWRGIFLINVPVSVLGLILALRFIPDVREEKVPPLDVRGFVLSGFGFAVLMLGLSSLGGHLMPTWVTLGCIVVGAIVIAAYVWHARRVEHPLIDFSLLSEPTYRAGVIGGSLFRIGMGAVPFLLPLMFQLGFGLSPSQSGLISMGTAMGAMGIRAASVRLLRRFGYRSLLQTNAVVSSVALAGYGLFTAATPHLVIFLVLLITGSMRSLQMNFNNTISFADVDKPLMSRATSLMSMAQRLSQSMGVALGAYALELSNDFQGHAEIVSADFWPAFIATALISLSSFGFYVKLSPDAGAELSGHRPKERAPGEATDTVK